VKYHLLIVDDDRGSQEAMRQIFTPNYEVTLASGVDEALEKLKQKRIDLIFADLIMPKKDGIALLSEVQDRCPGIPVIMVSGNASVQPVVKSMRKGAFDFVSKPFDVEELRTLAKRALETCNLQRNIKVLQSEMAQTHPVDEIVGRSALFLETKKKAEQAAQSESTVLITGESGTGKEFIARYIHNQSPRANEPFIGIHCGSIQDDSLESLLFGEENATAENNRLMGQFDIAYSGSLFLNEVSELSWSIQAKLLRVLESREYMRVGGRKILRTDTRILVSTSKDLAEEVKEGRFREDLYFRLNVVPLDMPPLRVRKIDIPLLAEFFLKQFQKTMDADAQGFDPAALTVLQNYFWPGNIRELRNIVERLMVLHRKQPIIFSEFLPDTLQLQQSRQDLPTSPYCSLEEAVSRYEKQLVENALRRAGGVQTRAAEILGTTRRILKYRMEKLDIQPRK
jgi:DNA-binding NtrC family response regulator